MLQFSRFASIVLLVVFASSARCGLVVHGPHAFEGHSYSLVLPDVQSSGLSWTDAKLAASQMTYLGENGYLATVTSAAENGFLDSTFRNFLRPLDGQFLGDFAWIGLTDSAQEGTFQWDNGEALAYTNWASTEPNGLGDEDYVTYWVRDGQFAWNDEDNAESLTFPGSLQGYIVEYNAVPEPSSLLFTLLFAPAVVMQRSRRRTMR